MKCSNCMRRRGTSKPAAPARDGLAGQGNRWPRATLVRVARAASHTKGAYPPAQYRRLAGRRGKKRARVASGPTTLVIIHQVLKGGTTCRGWGADYFARLGGERLTRTPARRLEGPGRKVTLQPQGPAA